MPVAIDARRAHPRRPPAARRGPPSHRDAHHERQVARHAVPSPDHPVPSPAHRAGARPAGGDAAAHRGTHPAGRGELPPVRRGPRALRAGAGGGCRRRDAHGPLPRRRGGAGPDRGPLSPGARPQGATAGGSPAPERGGAGVVHDPPVQRPRVRAAASLPRRRPAGPRLGSPHRPAGRAVGPAPRRARRGPPAAARPGSRLVAAALGQGPGASGRRARRPDLYLPDQAPAHRRRDHGRDRRGGAGGLSGLPLGAGRGHVDGHRAGGRGRRWRGPGDLGLAPVAASARPPA